MSKILCLYSYQTSSWVSCQKIVSNLWLNYKAASANVSSLHYGVEQKGQDLINLAQQIIAEKPDIISFIDHKPHPLELLQQLIPMWLENYQELPELIFHIYGDFTLNYNKWASLARILNGVKVKFCVASTAQKKLIQKFYSGDISIHPFSVSTDDFFYDEDLRNKTRNQLAIGNERLFIFTGRLSYQKNIHHLVEQFLAHLEEANSQDKLVIFGHYDDLGDPFADYYQTPGEYFQQIQRILKDHPKKDQIIFKGMADSQTLNSYYNASDCFVSLSTHNDEDFGMSIAESSVCGLPSILTGWGGFHDFNFPGNQFLKVDISVKKSVDLGSLRTYLSTSSSPDRSQISRLAIEKFSVQNSTKNLKKIIEKKPEPFTGFSELFNRTQKSAQYSRKMFLDFNNQLNDLYREIYDSYLG